MNHRSARTFSDQMVAGKAQSEASPSDFDDSRLKVIAQVIASHRSSAGIGPLRPRADFSADAPGDQHELKPQPGLDSRCGPTALAPDALPSPAARRVTRTEPACFRSRTAAWCCCASPPRAGASIPQCVPPIQQVLRDLARGRPFPTCGMAGAGNSRQPRLGQRARATARRSTRGLRRRERPDLHLRLHRRRVRSTSTARPSPAPGGRMAGDTVTEFSPAAKAQLGTWDTSFDDDYAAWLAALPPPAPPPTPATEAQAMDASTFLALALACAPQVHADTARALVSVESGFNPWAIGVVGGALVRQPRTPRRGAGHGQGPAGRRLELQRRPRRRSTSATSSGSA